MPPTIPKIKKPKQNGRLPGKLIVFEGIDGTGKTTQAKALASRLRRRGYRCLLSHEPGGTTLGKAIRKLLLHPPRGRWQAKSEVLLFLADRHEHVHTKIQPALKQGKHVILDRFTHSTLAFQGYGANLTPSQRRKLQSILDFATDGLEPDLVILLDMPARAALNRVKHRGQKKTNFEKRGAPWNEKVRRGFLSIARKTQQEGRGKCIVLNASQDTKKIGELVQEAVDKLL